MEPNSFIQSNRRSFISVLIFFILTIVIDQQLKTWALDLTAPAEFLGLQFFPIGNRGVLGGYLGDLDPWIIRIFFTVLFGFLCIGTTLVSYFLKHKTIPILKMGLVVYVSGMFGNVLDRMKTGAVTDYILIPIGNHEGMAFNFADLVVFVGFIFILVALYLESGQFWYQENKRQGYWIEPRFQFRFGMGAILIGFAHFFVLAIYSYVFLKVFITSTESVEAIGPERIIRDYLFGLFVIEGASLLLGFGISVLVSHRLVGPILALEQYLVKKLENPKTATLKLRRTDYFREKLESIAAKFFGPAD